MSPHSEAQALFELIEPVCQASGYELVDIEYRGGNSGLLRVYIDFLGASESPDDSTQDAKSIGFDDCERISRELSAVLDVEDVISQKYNLEVSSPGIDRPLRRPEHFRRHVGEEVKMSLRLGVDGRRNFKGRILSVDEQGERVVLAVDQHEFSLELADLASARLVPDWDALLKSQAKRA